MTSLAYFLLGLGFIFTGINNLINILKHIGNQPFRKFATKFIFPRWKALAFGFGSGAFLQSTSAAMIILASLNCTGGITVHQSIAILTGFSVGNCVLPFLVSLNIKLVMFLIVGVSAIALFFIKSDRSRNIFKLLFGLGLIFFGIEMMLEGVTPLSNEPWFSNMMMFSKNWSLLTIATGIILGFIIQSSSAVTIVAIGLTKGGIMTGTQALLIMYGAALGSTAFKVALGSAFRGSGQQLVRFVNIFNCIGAAIFIILYYVETIFNIPIVMAFLNIISAMPEHQIAIAFLMFNLTAAVAVSVWNKQIEVWLAYNIPPTEEEDLSKPKFLCKIQQEDPNTALALIGKEQLRELIQVSNFIETVRESYQGLHLNKRNEAFRILSMEITNAIAAVSSMHMDKSTALRHAHCQTCQTLIVQLADSMAETSIAINEAQSITAMKSFSNLFLETIDFLFIYAIETLQTGVVNKEEISILYSDRGPHIARIRTAFLKDNEKISSAERSCLLNLTISAEKNIWLLNRLLKQPHPNF